MARVWVSAYTKSDGTKVDGHWREISGYMKKFPSDAKSWSQATDEMRDLSRIARETISEQQGTTVAAIDYQAIKTPAEWNKKSKAFVSKVYKKMTPATKNVFYKYFKQYF